MTTTTMRAAAWVGGGAVVLALLAGGSYAAGRYDALNADRVDGRDAVGAKAGPAKRAGKLVAADKQGRMPDSKRVGGYTHSQLARMSIPPQAAFLAGYASAGPSGPGLPASTTSSFYVSFVVPPDHQAGSALTMRVSYREQSAGACGWYVTTDGLQGPVGGNDVPNVISGDWALPGSAATAGAVSVPVGDGEAHVATFTWAGSSDPGMFVQFGLVRDGDNGADTCGIVTVTGLQVGY